jgi:hypothetical protein
VNFSRRFGRFSNEFTPLSYEDNILRIWLRRQRGEGIEKILEDPKKGTAGMAPTVKPCEEN